jgi:hypothetical protein
MTAENSEQQLDHLRQLIMGFRISQMIYVAAKLGLATLCSGVRTDKCCRAFEQTALSRNGDMNAPTGSPARFL